MNAQGKSNILEAIYFLSAFSSFRNSRQEDMVRKGADFFFLEGEFLRQSGAHQIKAAFALNKKRLLKLDGNQNRKIGDMIGHLNAVIFSPEDLSLVKGNPQGRRKFLDGEIIQIAPAYFYYFQAYQKALSQRNTLLKQIRDRSKDQELLAVFDRQLATNGALILSKRQEILDRLAPLARLAHRKLTDGKEELLLRYQGGLETKTMRKGDIGEIENEILVKMKAERKNDIARGSTGFGPQKDDIIVQVDGDDIRSYGSQGQQRTAVLALKIAELELMKGQRGEYPLFLLDDVLSELDRPRREQLLNIVSGKVQTFITGTERHQFPMAGRFYEVRNGKIDYSS